jgi:hypothetical protein
MVLAGEEADITSLLRVYSMHSAKAVHKKPEMKSDSYYFRLLKT